MESSIKNDVRSILDILQQQQQQQYFVQKQAASGDAQVMTTSYQPSESDVSIELSGQEKRPRTSTSINVQRSVSQPECAASKDKSLLRFAIRETQTSFCVALALTGFLFHAGAPSSHRSTRRPTTRTSGQRSLR